MKLSWSSHALVQPDFGMQSFVCRLGRVVSEC